MDVTAKGNHELVGILKSTSPVVWEVWCTVCNVQFHTQDEIEHHLNGTDSTKSDAYDRAMKGLC